VKRITMALKLCVSDRGVPTTVSYVKSSDYTDANEKVMADVRKWRFRPYLLEGRPVPVCTATLLNYQIE
jgi:TonB family protein